MSRLGQASDKQGGATFWLLALSLTAVGVFSNWSFFRSVPEESRARVASVPFILGDWQGEDVSLDERSYEILETRDVLFRRYRSKVGAPSGSEISSGNEIRSVDLCIVFAKANRKASHPPEVCYLGSGAHVDRHPQVTIEFPAYQMERLAALPANVLLVTQGRTREVVLYWYLVGSELTTNFYKQQLAILWRQLLGQPAQGAMIRCSTPIVEESIDQAMERLRAFVQAHLPTVLDQIT